MSEATEDEKMLTGLCYPLWMLMAWFLLFSAKPFVKYHAVQSLVVGLASTCVYVLLWFVFWTAENAGPSPDALMTYGWTMVAWFGALMLVGMVIFVVLMVFGWKAWQGQLFRVPLAASIADKLAHLQ